MSITEHINDLIKTHPSFKATVALLELKWQLSRLLTAKGKQNLNNTPQQLSKDNIIL